jgi:hypothetical protein
VFRKLASRRDCIPDLAPIHHYLRQLIETIFEILLIDLELIDCFDAAYEVLPDPPTLITGRVLVMEAEPDSGSECFVHRSDIPSCKDGHAAVQL